MKYVICSRDGLSLYETETETMKEAIERASLDGANLDGARLDGANLDGARLDGASLAHASICDLGQDVRGWRMVAVQGRNNPTIYAGCRVFSPVEARAHWAQNPEMLAKLDQLDAVARHRGWALE